MDRWTLEAANEALPRVRELLARMREAATAADTATNGQRAPATARLQDALDALTSEGIVVRDVTRGLIDFPAETAAGDDYYLCWLDGEDEIEWWHWIEAGFAGRTPLSQPPESGG
jgi:hypothetical protein